jgi:hypothetical protein
VKVSLETHIHNLELSITIKGHKLILHIKLKAEGPLYWSNESFCWG